jgi:hypothetical protein
MKVEGWIGENKMGKIRWEMGRGKGKMVERGKGMGRWRDERELGEGNVTVGRWRHGEWDWERMGRRVNGWNGKE